MKHTLLNRISCPTCGNALELQEIKRLEEERIFEGSLYCSHCQQPYFVRNGMPHLLPEHLETLHVQEMEGWVNLWQDLGMYDRPTLEDSFRLPYVGGIWTDVARMFDMSLQEMNLTGKEVILEIGAGQGWASRYFAEKGCEVVAIDIVADEWYGLGRSWAIMDYAGVYFEPVLAEGEHLPFFSNQFDIVFLCGALHHFNTFDHILAQIYRVLKPGGYFIAAGEPSIFFFNKEHEIQSTLKETQVGITERRPRVAEYWRCTRRAGFERISIDTFETWHTSPSEVIAWIKAIRHNASRAVRTRYKLFVWLIFSLILVLPTKWRGQLALSLNGGNLFIRAFKPVR